MIKTTLSTLLAFINYVRKRYQNDNCAHSAAALTYMTLFSLVPLLTVVYAMASAVPSFSSVGDDIQSLLFAHLVPSTGSDVQEYLLGFSEKARKLTGIGLVFLFVTAFLMIKNIERTLNRIWRTPGNRSGLSSLLLYWAVLSLGPLCVAVALATSTYLLSMRFIDQYDFIGILPVLLNFIPYLAISVFLTLLFGAVPNCKVPIKHAIFGGLFTALVFEAAKRTFTGIVANSSYQHIYGAFAAIPLFLLWIYLSWLIILAGAQFTHALDSFSTEHRKRYADITVALSFMHWLWLEHKEGRAISEKDVLHKRWLFNNDSLTSAQWSRLRDKLDNAKLIQALANGKYILGRDLESFSLYDLCVALGDIQRRKGIGFKQIAESPEWLESSWRFLETAEQSKKDVLGTSLEVIFEQT